MPVNLYKLRWVFLSLIFWLIVVKNIPKEFLDFGGDSSQYIILAESLCKGEGYRAINYPDKPVFYHYPPLFSLVLLPIVCFWGRNFYLMHILTAFLGYLSLFFIYKIFKKYSDEHLAFLITAIFAANWIFIIYSSAYILSEIPYFLSSSFTLFMCIKYLEKDSFINKEGIFTLLGLIISYFTRYSAITLFLGVICVVAFQPKQTRFKKLGFIFMGFVIPIIFWQIIYKMLSPATLTKYSEQFSLIDPYRPYLGTIFEHPGHIFSRFIEGINYYYYVIGSACLPHIIFPNVELFVVEIVSFVSFIFVFLGLWRQFRKDKSSVLYYYFLIYFFLMAFWPFREGERFLLPVLPIIYFYFFLGLRKLLDFLPFSIRRRTFYTFLLCFLILNIFSAGSIKQASFAELSSSLQNFFLTQKWIKENLPQKGIIVSRKPTITYFYTGHQSIAYLFESQPDKLWKNIQDNKAKYVIVDSFSRETYEYLLPALYKNKDILKLLYRLDNTLLFEIKGG